MANGKAKGSKWERDLCRILTKWLIGGDGKKVVFWRSPSSGGLATIKTAENVSGDIISIKPESQFFTDIFSVEAKVGYPDVDFFNHFKKSKDKMKDFWSQCITNAHDDNKHGMLIYKKNRQPTVIGIENKVFFMLCDMGINLEPHLVFTYTDLPAMTLMDFATFLDRVKPKHIKFITPQHRL